jgi:replication factor C subunit 3/5
MLAEKYAPEELGARELKVTGMLRAFRAETFPSIIFTGCRGSGKRTLLNAFLKHLYGRKVQLRLRHVEVEISPSKKIDVDLLESHECVELDASAYGSADKKVIQDVVKELSSTKSVCGLLAQETVKNTKTLVIPGAEALTRGAQMALRRTMEKQAGNFRIIMLCTTVSPLIDAIKSRFLICRVPSFTDEEMVAICRDVCAKERVGTEGVEEVVLSSRGDLKRALSLIEMGAVRGTRALPSTEYEDSIKKVYYTAKKRPGMPALAEIRTIFYDMLSKGVSGREIMVSLVRSASAEEGGLFRRIVEKAVLYDKRISNGTKDIFHLEGFILSLMQIHEKPHR